MKENLKEKYLLDIKNAMFWHFSSSEIKETITDINTYFESAQHDGLSEETIIEQYGKPKMLAMKMRPEPDAVERKRKKSAFIKRTLLLFCMISAIFTFAFFPLSTASYMFVALSSIFIWFSSGNNCIAGILALTKEKKRFFWKNQIIIWLFFLLLQCSTLVFIPHLLRNYLTLGMFFGKHVRFIMRVMLVSLFLVTMFYLREMLLGNIYMFFIVVQNISIICGMFCYYDFITRLETLQRLGFLFTPYFMCLPVLFVYWIYMKGDVNGCTN